jgi:hypothetical protein
MKRLLLGVFCVLLSGMALAGGPDAVHKSVQASMLITGSITVEPSGVVRSYTLDQSERLPLAVVDLIGKSTKVWKFAPTLVDGQAVAAKARMSLRIVAKPVDDGAFALSVASACFDDDSHDDKPNAIISFKSHRPPNYPQSAANEGVSGTVYLLLLIGPDGRVKNVAAEQVNLRVIGSDREMDQWRRTLASTAVRGARHWTFNVPTSAKDDSRDHIVRAPVTFLLFGRPMARYGSWNAYVPGPRNQILWAVGSRLMAGSVDAVPAGGLSQVDQGMQLATPLNGA